MFPKVIKIHLILPVILFLILSIFYFANFTHAEYLEVINAALYFTPGNNSFVINGKIDPGLVDLTKDDLTFQVGPYSETIAASAFVKTGRKYIYKAEFGASGITEMILDLKKKSFSVTADGVDLFGTENQVTILVSIGDSYSECTTVNMRKTKDNSMQSLDESGKLMKSSSKCKSILPANITGGCKVRLAGPGNCATIKLPHVFGWTTGGTYCETPWRFIIAGNPVNLATGANTWEWSLSEDVSQGITHKGGLMRITAQDLKNVTTNNGIYHWVVIGYYGSHPASRAFKVKK